MSTKRDALMQVIGKVGKILPLLASDKAGEVTGAAGRLVQVLASVHLDLHDVTALLKEEPVAKPTNALFETDPEALLRIASDGASFFLDLDHVAYADIDVDGHRETWPLTSHEFSFWLMRQFDTLKSRIPTATHMKSAIRSIGAKAAFSSKERYNVHSRIAEAGGKIYLDLANDAWQAIEVDSEGWRVTSTPPVRFRRTAGMRSIPLPQRGGSINELRPFVNLADDAFTLVVSFALDIFRTGRAHPVLYLAGDEGTAKSTLTRILGTLLDPHRTKLRNLPAVHDLFVSAHNQHVLCFDNISVIPVPVSDALCQLASGAGFGIRKKYTDSDEFSVAGSHPIVLNGIGNCIDRPDLADRAVVLDLPRIQMGRRRPESEFWAAFDAARPKLIGALLDAVVHGLANVSTVQLPHVSRLVDFERWATACEPAFAEAGSFQRAFHSNTADTVEGLVDNDPVAKAIGAMMLSQDAWEGTAAELLVELTNYDRTEARVARLAHWPKDPARFSKSLRSMAATLAKAGIEVSFGKAADRRRTRTVRLRNRAPEDSSDAPSHPQNGGSLGLPLTQHGAKH
jgi:hypothetical protein